jgi:hypothetical protein
MTGVTLNATDAAELAEMLQFLADWLQRDPERLRASLEDFAAIPPRPPADCAGGVQGGGGSAELANLEGKRAEKGKSVIRQLMGDRSPSVDVRHVPGN